jgi:hypothetical protein
VQFLFSPGESGYIDHAAGEPQLAADDARRLEADFARADGQTPRLAQAQTQRFLDPTQPDMTQPGSASPKRRRQTGSEIVDLVTPSPEESSRVQQDRPRFAALPTETQNVVRSAFELGLRAALSPGTDVPATLSPTQRYPTQPLPPPGCTRCEPGNCLCDPFSPPREVCIDPFSPSPDHLEGMGTAWSQSEGRRGPARKIKEAEGTRRPRWKKKRPSAERNEEA